MIVEKLLHRGSFGWRLVFIANGFELFLHLAENTKGRLMVERRLRAVGRQGPDATLSAVDKPCLSKIELRPGNLVLKL